MTLRRYAPRWLRRIQLKSAPRAYDAHADAMRRHILPGPLADVPLVELRRKAIRAFLEDVQLHGRAPCSRAACRALEPCPHAGLPLAAGSLRHVYSALRACLQAAVEDEELTANPATRLGGKHGLRLEPTARDRAATAAARLLPPAELRALLAHLDRPGTPQAAWLPIVLTYARAGLRLGEAPALAVVDFDPSGTGSLTVRRAQNKRTHALEPPKHGIVRTVDLAGSPELVECLRRHVAGLKKRALATGTPLGRWLFPTATGTRVQSRNMARALTLLCAGAGIPARSAHDLRHTYATRLVEAGAPLDYVQKQLGHATIQITMDYYAPAARTKLPAALRGVLDDAGGGAADVAAGSQGR